MTGLTFLALCSMAVGAGDSDDYADAHQATMKTGKPMVVMVSTEWCAPCQMMKRTVIPAVRKHGLLAKVAFAIVNPDRDHDLAQKLTGGGPVPQLVMFRKTATGWNRRILIGGQTVESVEQFIKEDIAASDKTEKTAVPAPPKATPDAKPLTKADKPGTPKAGAVVTSQAKAGDQATLRTVSVH